MDLAIFDEDAIEIAPERMKELTIERERCSTAGESPTVCMVGAMNALGISNWQDAPIQYFMRDDEIHLQLVSPHDFRVVGENDIGVVYVTIDKGFHSKAIIRLLLKQALTLNVGQALLLGSKAQNAQPGAGGHWFSVKCTGQGEYNVFHSFEIESNNFGKFHFSLDWWRKQNEYSLKEGLSVIVMGLKSETGKKLNSKIGTIISKREKGRFGVCFAGGKEVSILGRNLIPDSRWARTEVSDVHRSVITKNIPNSIAYSLAELHFHFGGDRVLNKLELMQFFRAVTIHEVTDMNQVLMFPQIWQNGRYYMQLVDPDFKGRKSELFNRWTSLMQTYTERVYFEQRSRAN